MVAKWNRGVHSLHRLRNDMDRLFGYVFNEVPGAAGPLFNHASFPLINIWEDENVFVAEAELPGVKMEDLDVSVVGNELTLKGRRKDDPALADNYHRRERATGSFTRVLQLPIDVDVEKVEAALHNGVLTLTLPKAAAALPRKIEVKALPK